MTQKDLENLACELSAVSVFRGVRNKKPMAKLIEFLRCGDSLPERMDIFGEFVCSLAGSGFSLSDFLKKAVCEDENPYIAGMAHKRALPDALIRNAKREHDLFS